MTLLDWQPPQPVERFAEDQVRGASLDAKICRGIAVALKDSAFSREDIAARMSDYLGQRVGRNMLDAYASQAREDHVINVVRFVALLHATRDRRLLELLAEQFGWAVIERRYLKLIELAALQEQEDTLKKKREALRRQAKGEGSI